MPNADAAWVDVLPSLAKFQPALRQGLAGVMSKAGQDAGNDYAQGFRQTAVSGVERASAQVAAARKKEADAAGAVRVAEARLQDLRDSGKAKAAQLVAAEENLAKAQRTLSTQNDAVGKSTKDLAAAQQQAARGADTAAESMGRAHGSSGLLSGGLSRLQGGIMLASGALLGGAGLVAGLKGLYDQAAESARIGRLTTQVIASTGGAAKITAAQVGDLATAISNKTGVDDEAIQSASNLLLTFTSVRNEVGKGNDIFNQATQIVTDMSAALGQDMSSSAIQLGKALNDPIKGITALQRVGVSFTEQQKDQIRVLVQSGDTLDAQKIILAELGREFGGAAAAASTPLDKLKVSVGNVAEQLGGYLIPAVDKAATWITRDLIPGVQHGVSWLGDHFAPVIHVVEGAFTGLVSAGKGVASFFEGLPAPIQAAVIALGAVKVLGGPVSTVFTTIGGNISMVGAIMRAEAVSITESGTVMGIAGGIAKAGWAGFMTLLGGPLGLAIAGATLAFVALSGKTDDNTKKTHEAADAQGELAQALMQSKGAIDTNVRAAAAKEAQDKGILTAAQTAGVRLSTVTDAILGQGNAYNSVISSLMAYRDANTGVDGQRTKEAVQVNQAIGALQDLAGSTDTNVTKAQQLATATGQQSDAQSTAQKTAADLNTELQDTATAASDAKQATDLLKTSLDILTGAHIDMSKAEADFYAAVDASDGALKNLSGHVLDNAGHLDLQTEAGRKTQDILIGVHDSADQLIATMIQQGATSDQANAKDAELRKSFYNTALQMTGSKQAAFDLTNQIYGIPDQRTTKINADTKQATDAVAAVQAAIDALHGRIVSIEARTVSDRLQTDLAGRPVYQGFGAASGAVLPGFTPGRDVHDFYSPTAGMRLSLSGGEAVMRPEFTAAVGSGWVDSVNAAARSGGVSGVRSAIGMAGGGVLPPVSVQAELDTGRYNAEMDARAQSVLRVMEPVMGFIRALDWARTQVGKPYIWGGVGPVGYDCSGFQSAITNVIRGQSPYSRVGSTANFPWAGFAPGFGMYSIGSTPDAGGGIGHMAGTLLGVNVESTGDHVRVGGDARGASNGLFSQRDHFVADTGGLVPHGATVTNLSGGVERFLTPPQDDYFTRFVDAMEKTGGGAPTYVGLKNDGVIVVEDFAGLQRMQSRGARRSMARKALR